MPLDREAPAAVSAPMERLVEDFKAHGVTSKFFSDPTAAMMWLEEQP